MASGRRHKRAHKTLTGESHNSTDNLQIKQLPNI